MIERLVPQGVAAVDAFEDVAGPGARHPPEGARIARGGDPPRRAVGRAHV
ncbi:hypothetical protein [Streptomyces sp. NPDC004285]